MENLVKDFSSQKRFAVVGSFRNESKFAYKILKDSIKREYNDIKVIHSMCLMLESLKKEMHL